MQALGKVGPDGPRIVQRFYHTHAFSYLIKKWLHKIKRRVIDIPLELRQHELATQLEALGEAGGDAAWQIFWNYLDAIERRIAEIVRGHSPSYWFHLHRRLRPILPEVHERKTDNMTVRLVRRIAELAYAKYGDLSQTDDLGLIIHTRMKDFLDGAWYEATAQALGSKLKAQKEYQEIKRTKQVVLIDFHVSDLCDVFGVEGLCYEYWWASAVMRSIGKGSFIKWDPSKTPPIRYRDAEVPPLCFDFYDQRNSEGRGFQTRLGTWIDEPENLSKSDKVKGDEIIFAQLIPNPKPKEYPAWDPQTKEFGREYGAMYFELGTFSLAKFKSENSFMAEPFKQKHCLELDTVLFAIWVASFFGIYTGITSPLASKEKTINRTMANLGNLFYRGYTMKSLNLDQLAQNAVWCSEHLEYERTFSFEEAQKGLEFISLSESAQENIGLWSGGKCPILIPSMNGLMIDLAAIVPFLSTIFFGLKKTQQVGGDAFENSVRAALKSRGQDLCWQGILQWQSGDPREVDAAVRIGDRLVLIECFSYELPVDYEVGKPSIFEKRKEFISRKLEQARTLAERVSSEPTGTNFDFSWAKTVDWRLVSPFVEFAWHLKEPLIDEAGLPRVLQVNELIDYLINGDVPAKAYVPRIKKFRDRPLEGLWC
jgi:hypothetical protein